MVLKDRDHNTMITKQKVKRKAKEETKTKHIERLQYPIAKDGYAESIGPTNEKEILHRLDRFGLVVIPVLSPQEKLQLLDAFFQEANEQQRPLATRPHINYHSIHYLGIITIGRISHTFWCVVDQPLL